LFYKPATPGTDEVDVLENQFAWHKVNTENSGGLIITTNNGLISNIKIGYEPGVDVNSIASQIGSHHCIVDNKEIGYANIEVVSNWNNTSNVTITVVSIHNGITTTYTVSAQELKNDLVRIPEFNTIANWTYEEGPTVTNTRSDYISKTAIIPYVRNSIFNPVLLTKAEFIDKYGFDPVNHTMESSYFTALTDIGLV
jgi:hypothetical protein